MGIDESLLDDDELQRRQMWRRLRGAITLLVLIIVVIGAAWFGWRNITKPAQTDAAAGPTCAPSAPDDAPKAGDITLNVYNSTSRDGLAAQVAKQMRKRGFSVADIANDPLNRSIEAVAEVRSNLDNQGAASVVIAHVPQAEFVADERATKSVDLVLGDGFTELAGNDDATPITTSTLPPCQPTS